MEKIPSFRKNHDELKTGLYDCGTSNGVTTWDLRFKTPNGGDYISPKALHTVEHIIATLLRNSEYKNNIVYFGPMGCRTGFYLLTTGLDRDRTLALLKTSFYKAAEFTEIPGSRREECGNYLEHDLADALRECREYMRVLEQL
ncbi:MAG: S-ribosylhomocysteine lyase [Roseburia sp.]|nr:S-ribosylhomocysteine lyase [Roseburia sp.]